MFKTKDSGRRQKVVEIHTWHERTIIDLNGSLVVTLPKQLLTWDRWRSTDGAKWSAGDKVKIAMTPEGWLVIQFVDRQPDRAYGPLLDEFKTLPDIMNTGWKADSNGGDDGEDKDSTGKRKKKKGKIRRRG